jgi:hypothetical protein
MQRLSWAQNINFRDRSSHSNATWGQSLARLPGRRIVRGARHGTHVPHGLPCTVDTTHLLATCSHRPMHV